MKLVTSSQGIKGTWNSPRLLQVPDRARGEERPVPLALTVLWAQLLAGHFTSIPLGHSFLTVFEGKWARADLARGSTLVHTRNSALTVPGVGPGSATGSQHSKSVGLYIRHHI